MANENAIENMLLKDGWMDGEGKAASRVDVEWFVQMFDGRWLDSLPMPRIYPTHDGGLQAEWLIERTAISLAVEFPTKQAYYHQLHLDTKTDLDFDVDLNNSAGWEKLKLALLRVTGSATL
jgi:hypothetical protein